MSASDLQKQRIDLAYRIMGWLNRNDKSRRVRFFQTEFGIIRFHWWRIGWEFSFPEVETWPQPEDNNSAV